MDPASSLRTARRTVIEYANVAVNTPSDNWLYQSRKKLRSTRGENWLDASWRATIVMLNTSTISVSVEPLTIDSSTRAPSGPPSKKNSPTAVPPWRSSHSGITKAWRMARARNTPGRNHRAERKRSTNRRTLMVRSVRPRRRHCGKSAV